MQYAIQDYDDIFTGISPQILKNIYIRFYTIQDYYQLKKQPNLMCQQKQAEKECSINFFWNRIIHQCIMDLMIMNKLIYGKAKLVHGLLQNGRAISQKKNTNWQDFLNEKDFQQVKLAFSYLSSVKKTIIKYTIASISNLLLKLSINMSKVSILPLQKLINFEVLNIPVLSVIYLQYIQYKLWKSKNFNNDKSSQLNFMKQLPKITFIKLNYCKNNTQRQMLLKSQQNFINNPVKQNVKNLQFIQIYQLQNDPIKPKSNFNNSQNYPYFYQINLQQLGAKSPFTFQILQVMRQIIFPIVKDFKPDLIVYMQSYPNGHRIMDDQVRALMICQMSQEIGCNKMYVFKQMGEQKTQLLKYKQLCKQGQIINQQIANYFQQCQKQTITKNEYKNQLNISLKSQKSLKQKNQKKIKKWKKIFINQLCFISLALIQKTSFDNALQASHKHFFNRKFLLGIQNIQNKIVQNKIKIKQNLINLIKVKREGIKMMIQTLDYKLRSQNNTQFKAINLMNRKSKINKFYNLKKQCQQNITVMNIEQNKLQQWFYTQQDTLIVKYLQNQKQCKIILFLIKYIETKHQTKIDFKICSKFAEQINFKYQNSVNTNIQRDYLQGATYVCSNQYLYRGFGRLKLFQRNQDDQYKYNQCIHRLRIYPKIDNNWQIYDNIAMNLTAKCPLQRKVYGYGMFDKNNNSIHFCGGYVDSSNQQKISKNIYSIKNVDSKGQQKQVQKKITVMGKTNKILFNTNQNLKSMFLHPFVFGIPLLQKKNNNMNIINTNGYYLNLNYNGKIFLTQFKLSNTQQFNGINNQNKLLISNNLDNASISIFLSQVLIKCSVLSCNQINSYNNKCVFTTLDQGNIQLQLIQGTKKIKIRTIQIFQKDIWNTIQFVLC